MHVFTSQNSAPQSIAVSAHKSQGKYHLFVLLLLYCRLLASLIFRPQWKKALTFWSPPASGQSKVHHSVPLHSRQTSEKELCAGKVSHSYSLGELLWIDTDLGSNSIELPLSDFPSNLMLQGERFTLRAVIAFKGGLSQDALGYYVAYCRRSPCVWEMYDDLRSGVTGVSEKNKICPYAVLYTQKIDCTV